MVAKDFPKRSLKECHALMTQKGTPFEMEEVEIGGLKLRAYKNAPPSLRALWMAVQAFGKRDYIVYQEERITYEQAHKKVVQIANMFKNEYGCKKGDRIGVAARNLPEWILSFWATEMLGCVFVAINCWGNNDVLDHCVTIAECRLLLLDAERGEVLKSLVPKFLKSGVKEVLVFRGEEKNMVKGMGVFDQRLAASKKSDDVPQVDLVPEDISTIFFTSGTTGLPKGVIGTHRQIVTNIINMMIPPVRAALRRGESMPTPDPNALQKCSLIGVPFFHATGCHSVLCTTTALGGKLVLLHKWNTDVAADLIIKEKVTSAGGMPFMGIELTTSKLAGKKNFLEVISYGGGPASKELPSQIPKALGTAPGQGYGATELSSACANFSGEDYELRPTSTGPPCLVNDAKIVCLESGKTLPANERGEIYIKGVNRTNGYLKAPEATKEVFLDDGYYKTGDIGYLDDEGFLYILDRAKDIIIRGGENIASVIVENAIFEDPRIADVAVVPVPDSKLGELVAAAAVTHPAYHGQVKEADLIAMVSKKLQKHMIPVFIDIRSETLPRNGIGKTMKRDLKHDVARLWEERKAVGLKAKL